MIIELNNMNMDRIDKVILQDYKNLMSLNENESIIDNLAGIKQRFSDDLNRLWDSLDNNTQTFIREGYMSSNKKPFLN